MQDTFLTIHVNKSMFNTLVMFALNYLIIKLFNLLIVEPKEGAKHGKSFNQTERRASLFEDE